MKRIFAAAALALATGCRGPSQVYDPFLGHTTVDPPGTASPPPGQPYYGAPPVTAPIAPAAAAAPMPRYGSPNFAPTPAGGAGLSSSFTPNVSPTQPVSTPPGKAGTLPITPVSNSGRPAYPPPGGTGPRAQFAPGSGSPTLAQAGSTATGQSNPPAALDVDRILAARGTTVATGSQPVARSAPPTPIRTRPLDQITRLPWPSRRREARFGLSNLRRVPGPSAVPAIWEMHRRAARFRPQAALPLGSSGLQGPRRPSCRRLRQIQRLRNRFPAAPAWRRRQRLLTAFPKSASCRQQSTVCLRPALRREAALPAYQRQLAASWRIRLRMLRQEQTAPRSPATFEPWRKPKYIHERQRLRLCIRFAVSLAQRQAGVLAKHARVAAAIHSARRQLDRQLRRQCDLGRCRQAQGIAGRRLCRGARLGRHARRNTGKLRAAI